MNKIGVSDKVVRVVSALSMKSGSVLDHLKEVIPSLSEEEANSVMIIKMSDRIDNLETRIQNNRLNDKYREKSMNLLRYIKDNYTGPMDVFNVMEKRMLGLLGI
jgi:ArsR family metal-binding transcriptional regulator